MSKKSITILKQINLNQIIKQRQSNYKALQKSIKSLYKSINKNTCPLKFPILTKDRESIRKKLIQNGIYPSIHWKLEKEVSKKFKQSKDISNKILTLPIDHIYTTQDMNKIIQTMKK